MPTDNYMLRFSTGPNTTITKDEVMALARSEDMSLRDFILNALAHERDRVRHTPLADDGPLSSEQFDWLWAQFPEGTFEDEKPIGPALW